MPRYRKLHTQTTQSLDVNDMPDDFTRLLWVMLPLALCREGRGMDNPSWVRSNVFPIRLDVTLGMINGAMDWYAEHSMITRYATNGRAYFLIPTFHKYQGNTVKEAESIYPPPPDDQSPTESVSTPDEVQTDAILAPDEVQTNSTTDSVCNIQYSDSDSEGDAVFNSDADASKTSPPPSQSSSYSQNSQNLERLQEKHGRDPLDGLVKFAQRQEAKNKGRPAGWGSVNDMPPGVWTICELVAEQFPCALPIVKPGYNAITREMAEKRIDKWTGGATMLLEEFNGDVKRTLAAITTFRLTWDGGFTVAGPQSLLNSVGPGLASKPASKPRRGQRGEGYEPHSDAERTEAWAQYEDDLRRFIEERGTDENLDAVADEFAAFIGRDIGVAHAVLEARSAREALAMEPINVEAFFNET